MNKVYDMDFLEKQGFNIKYIIDIKQYETVEECEDGFQDLLSQVIENIRRKFVKTESKDILLLYIDIAFALVNSGDIKMTKVMNYYDEKLSIHIDNILNMNDNFILESEVNPLFFKDVPPELTSSFIDMWKNGTFNDNDKVNIWLFIINMLILLVKWKELQK